MEKAFDSRRFAKARVCLRLKWLAVVGVIPLLGAASARSDGWIVLSPGPGYRLEWRTATARRFITVPEVKRRVLGPLDRWFQVAPGGEAVALRSSATGLAVFQASGEELLRRKEQVSAFRFSPAGDRIAFATAKGIEIFDLGHHEPRSLAPLAGIDWLEWTNSGLVARTPSNLYLIDFAGHARKLAKLGRSAVVAAVKGRVVYFADRSLQTKDLANNETIEVTKLADPEPVINAAISPDGANLLFATAKRVYLREGSGPINAIADAAGVQSLFFSPDGGAYLWGTATSGRVVVRGGATRTLPEGTRSARFAQYRNSLLVLTAEDGVATWDANTGARAMVGGISLDDGTNLAGDITEGNGVVVLYYNKSGDQKEREVPRESVWLP